MIEAPSPPNRRGWIAPFGAATLALCVCMLAAATPLHAGESTETIVIPSDRFTRDAAQHSETETEAGGIDSERRFNFAGFRSELFGLWFKRKAFLLKNLPEAAGEQMTAIENLCGEMGVTRLDDVAAALVHEGRGYVDEGNFEKARVSFEEAVSFAADLPEAHFGLASVAWRSGGGVGQAAKELLLGLRALFRNSALSSAFLGNLLIVCLLALAATAVLFSIGMVLRYQSLVRHDVEEVFLGRHRGRTSRELLVLWGWVVLLLPILTWVAAVWTPVYWLALTFRYQLAREKAISAALLLMVLLSPPAARAAEILFGLASDPSARLMLASTSGSYDPEQIVALEERASLDPKEPAYRFLLGGLYARGRYFREARTQYQQVLELDPTSHRALNNLGNIYLRAGRPEEALKFYKTALAQDHTFLPSWYNSYLAHKEQLQLKEAEQALIQGQQVDPEGLSALLAGKHGHAPTEPIEAVITRDEVFRRILGEQSGSRRILSSLASFPSILAATLLTAAAGMALLRRGRHAARCIRCGDPYCEHCKASDRVPEYCSQCQHITISREGISPAIRKGKLEQAERFREAWLRLCRVSSLLMPGMGRILDGRAVTGTAACALWCGALLALLLRPHLLQPPNGGVPTPFLTVTIALASFAGAAWLLGNRRSVRRANAPVGAWQWR